MVMEEYSIVLEDVVKKFGDFTAVNGVSLKILRGEFLVSWAQTALAKLLQ